MKFKAGPLFFRDFDDDLERETDLDFLRFAELEWEWLFDREREFENDFLMFLLEKLRFQRILPLLFSLSLIYINIIITFYL